MTRVASVRPQGSDVTVNIIKGHVYHAVGKANKASQQYMIAVREAPADCPLEVFLRLSETLDLVGAADGALKVLLTVSNGFVC